MKKLIVVAHCLLNNGSKLQSAGNAIKAEDDLRKDFITLCVENDIQILQLPCPEVTIYGARRWGHCSNQFDNPFFKDHCRKILKPIIHQLQEYDKEREFYEILGIIGVDGSPSCGVDYTYKSDNWFGEFSDRATDLISDISSIERAEESGVFIKILKEELEKSNLDIKITGLFVSEKDKVYEVINKAIK